MQARGFIERIVTIITEEFRLDKWIDKQLACGYEVPRLNPFGFIQHHQDKLYYWQRYLIDDDITKITNQGPIDLHALSNDASCINTYDACSHTFKVFLAENGDLIRELNFKEEFAGDERRRRSFQVYGREALVQGDYVAMVRY